MRRWRRRRSGGHDSQAGVPARARAAFHAALADSTFDLIRVADTYVGWAEGHGSRAEQAEAYWMRSVVTAREAMRRELPADRLRILSASQGIAAEAGYHLAAAGRPRDAVITVEHARGVMLSRLAGGLAPAARAALIASGRRALLDSYLAASRNLAAVYRRQLAGETSSSEAGTGSPARIGVPSELQAAQADVARLGREVTALTGGPDLLDLPSYEVIQQAAQLCPVVYVAAAKDTGYALIVRHTGEPVIVGLPALHGAALDEHVRSFTSGPVWPAAVRACVDWLAAEALAPLTAQLSAEPEAALVSLGVLNPLPVSAALIQATSGRAAGPLATRHLPNARVAAGLPPWPRSGSVRSVLVVEAADPPGEPRLAQARTESAVLARRYAARRLSAATRSAVLRALNDADLVEFLCHGRADLTEPLNSGLLLADGWLTVRTLFSQPPLPGPLIILAACESHVSGVAAPDEIIGLPTVLYQAGAAGIVAAGWQVEERAAILLLRRFHDQLSAGSSPAHALAAAQHWLRTATYGAMSSCYPDVFAATPPPATAEIAAARQRFVPYADPEHWAPFSYTGT